MNPTDFNATIDQIKQDMIALQQQNVERGVCA